MRAFQPGRTRRFVPILFVLSEPGLEKQAVLPGPPVFFPTATAGFHGQEESEKNMPHAADTNAQLNLYIKFLKERLFFEPSSSIMHYNLGLAYSQKQLLDEAISEFKQALECDSQLAQACVNIGGLYFRKGEVDQCIAFNLKALEIDPNLPMAHANLGFAYFQKQEFLKAIESSKQAVQLIPDHLQAYNTLAMAYIGAKQFQAGAEAARKILEINENFAPAHYALSVAFRMTGDMTKAAEHFEIAKNLGYPVDQENETAWDVSE